MPFEPKVDVDEDCLICCEPLNHDLNFYPCPCEFQVSLWSFGFREELWIQLEKLVVAKPLKTETTSGQNWNEFFRLDSLKPVNSQEPVTK